MIIDSMILVPLIFSVSVGRYRCETAQYAQCDPSAGRIMRDFFYAGITNECREDTGVTSQYTTKFGGTAVIAGSGFLVACCAFLASLTLIQTNG